MCNGYITPRHYRTFTIEEYSIKLHYKAIPYGWGWWNQEESDDDLFCHIYESYKNDDFYKHNHDPSKAWVVLYYPEYPDLTEHFNKMRGCSERLIPLQELP